MRNVFLAIILLTSTLFAGTFKVTTNYKSEIDLDSGKIKNYKESTTFIIGQSNDRFVHVTNTITSVYIFTDTAKVYSLTQTDVITASCRSEAGNYYLFLFDYKNKRIVAYPSTGNYIVEFDIANIEEITGE